MVSSISPSAHVYTGEFRHSLDGKNRVTIPSAWRQNETDGFFLIPSSSQPCLLVMPPEEYKRTGEEAKLKAPSPEHHRLFMRYFYAKAQYVTTDKQGRLLLPEEFCAKLGLRGDTILTGTFDRIEIWNPANWNTFVETAAGPYVEVANTLGL